MDIGNGRKKWVLLRQKYGSETFVKMVIEMRQLARLQDEGLQKYLNCAKKNCQQVFC